MDGLFTSKIRYGLQLYGKVRFESQDPVNGDLKDIQIVQNKMMRSLLGKKISDKVHTEDLLKTTNISRLQLIRSTEQEPSIYILMQF